MKGLTSIITILLITTIADGQQLQQEDLNLLYGRWKGNLIYTDYSDDKTRVTLQTRLQASSKKGKVKMQYFYTEPNGEVVGGSETMGLSKNESEFDFDGKWEIKDFQRSSDGWRLEIEKEGKDNNRRSTLKKEISLSGENLRITKNVKYEGTDDFFQRNTYQFIKQ